MNQFWMVWNYHGNAPRFKHESEGAAIAEAERLATDHAGQTFVVLEATHVRKVDSMQRANLRTPSPDDSDIPF